MGMKDTSLIDKINPTFMALTATDIHHSLLAWKTGEFRILPELGPGGGAQRKWEIRNIYHVVNNACTDVFRRLDEDFCSSSAEAQGGKIDDISRMICRRMHSTGTDPAKVQPHNDRGSYDEDFVDYVPEELIELPDMSPNCLSSLLAATEASIGFSAVLLAIASSSQPVPCSNSNSNSNYITNMTSVANMGLVDGSTIVESAMSLGC
jgi:hypothetical protein